MGAVQERDARQSAPGTRPGGPINLNTASDADILSIPGVGQRMVQEFKEYRPWKSREQFAKEI